MRVHAGIALAKEVHWATALDEAGEVRLDHRVENTPAALAALGDELRAIGGDVTIGFDGIGGSASLAEAMLAAAGFRLVHVPGLAVNRARQGTSGGESKSDPRDARVIADQVRVRRDLRSIDPATELDLDIRLLVGRRGDLVEEQTRRLARMHDLLVAIFPGLERALDRRTKGGLWLVTRFVTPAELRGAGHKRVAAHLRRAGGLPNVEALAVAALGAAAAQHIAVPGEHTTASLVRELASEALATRDRLIRLDRELEALLARHPDAVLLRSLPGMGAVLTAEFIAQAGNIRRDHSAAALAPVLRQSGKVRFPKRPTGGNKARKRVFFQSAFCALHSPDSRAFYDRKRREGKTYQQAVLALARRRVNVLWAILHSRMPFEANHRKVA